MTDIRNQHCHDSCLLLEHTPCQFIGNIIQFLHSLFNFHSRLRCYICCPVQHPGNRTCCHICSLCHITNTCHLFTSCPDSLYDPVFYTISILYYETFFILPVRYRIFLFSSRHKLSPRHISEGLIDLLLTLNADYLKYSTPDSKIWISCSP